jgi:hypothetical protein
MTRLRRALGPLVVAGLLLQSASLTLAAADLLGGGHMPGSATTCACPHGVAEGPCPMHGSNRDADRCRIRSTQSDTGALLLSLLSSAAVPPSSVVAIAEAPASGVVTSALSRPIDHVFSPASPPPRS